MDDDRLREALVSGAREPTVDGVLGRVQEKRAHRRRVRRAQQASVGLAMVVAVVTVGIVVLDDRGAQQQVAVAPGPGAAPLVRVIEDGRSHVATVRSVRLDEDEGYLRGPMLLGADGTIALAAYDRAGGSYRFPPSRVVVVEADGTVVDRIDLQGEVLSLAEGEGARWALTHDKTVIGPLDPEYRVKRLGPDGSVASSAVPPGEEPVGRIAAGGGGVWLPVRDGVLRFDPVTGTFAGKISLPTPSARRAVVTAGKFSFVTDGSARVRLDPAQQGAAGVVDEVDPGIELTDATNVPSQGVAYLLGFDSDEGAWIVTDGSRVLVLHETFVASSIAAAGSTVWVDGTIDGRRALVLLDTAGSRIQVASTIRLTNIEDAAVLVLSGRSALVTSKGSLARTDLR